MSDHATTGTPIVHALLTCRGVETDAQGDVTLQNVVEIIPVEDLPSDVGPLVFVAFVRNLPAGPQEAAFLLRRVVEGAPTIGRLPLDLDVPLAYGGRQVALQMRLPSFPVEAGGWFEVAFEWRGQELAANRFAVGARTPSSPKPDTTP